MTWMLRTWLRFYIACATAIACNIALAGTAPSVQITHIVVKSRQAAEYGKTLLMTGTSARSLARRWSIDPGSESNSGDLPVRPCDAYSKGFTEAVCIAEVGVPWIVETQYGWHIVVVNARSGAGALAPDAPPVAPPLELHPSIQLACSFATMRDRPLAVLVDEPQRAAKVGGLKALPTVSDVHIVLHTPDGNVLTIDRTTGMASVRLSPSGEILGGIECRSVQQRRF